MIQTFTDISAAQYNLWLVNYSNSTEHNVDASQGMVIFLLKNVCDKTTKNKIIHLF